MDRDELESDDCPQPYTEDSDTVAGWTTSVIGPKKCKNLDGVRGKAIREFGNKHRYVWSKNWKSLEEYR